MSLWERARAAFIPRRLRSDYRFAFDTEQGKRVLGSIFDTCGLTRTTLERDAYGRVDPEAVLVAEGRRQVGLFIQDMLRMSEDEIRDLEEHNSSQGDYL